MGDGFDLAGDVGFGNCVVVVDDCGRNDDLCLIGHDLSIVAEGVGAGFVDGGFGFGGV